MPSVAYCHAMRNLLSMKQNRFYNDYRVVVAAGSAAGIGAAALAPVEEAMDDPLTTKTITLSCGKLTTGSATGRRSQFQLTDAVRRTSRTSRRDRLRGRERFASREAASHTYR